MAIVRRDDFSWFGANPNKCFAFNRPKTSKEAGVFLLGVADTEEAEMRGVKGQVEISESAVKHMAGMLGWVPGDKLETALAVAQDLQEFADAAEKELEELKAAGKTPGAAARELSRDLDLVTAQLDDAVTQFHAAEQRIRELEQELEIVRGSE